MLRACRRVLKPGGVLSYYSIAVAPGLDREKTERALAVGPDELDAGPGYLALTEAAGFRHIDVVDVTAEYEATLATLIDEWVKERAALERLVGEREIVERHADRTRTLQAIRAGLIVRYLITAVRAGSDLAARGSLLHSGG